MTTNKIDELLNRYEQGITTEKEELSLRELAVEGQLPDEWNDYFAVLDGSVTVPDGLEERLERRIDAMQLTEHLRRRKWWRRVTGIAAMVVILLSVGVYIHNQRQTQAILEQDTYTDPQEAYNQTEQVLTMLSKQLNKSDDGMHALEIMTQKLNNK